MATIGRFTDVWNALEAIYAYEMGATDSGVKDEELRQECIKVVAEIGDRSAQMESLTRYCRDHYFSDEAMAAGYGIQDAAEFYTWVDWELG